MKKFLIILAIGLATSDKLDRIYLPPPGAQFSGGIPGDIDVPFELPHQSHSGPEAGHSVGHKGPLTNIGINGEQVEFGDKIPKVPFTYYSKNIPTTTTSYAFSQTTTYPPAESYETTALPINPVTGLPVQLDQVNFPYGSTQGQQNVQNLPSYTQNTVQRGQDFGTNVQPDFSLQDTTPGPITYGNPSYGLSIDQSSRQYTKQNVITPGGSDQIRELVSQSPVLSQGLIQYADGQTPATDVIIPGDTTQIPEGNQVIEYPKTVVGQQGLVQSTAPPRENSTGFLSGGDTYSTSYDGSQGQIPQGTYSGQQINVQNLGKPQLNQAPYQNREPFNVGGIPSQQYPSGNQNQIDSRPRGSNFENVNQPSLIPSTIPPSYYTGVSSATRFPNVPSVPALFSIGNSIFHPERPQADADRKAVILSYENVRTPNTYSYSFDTSNGIHADETGIVDNGTKAQGAYSYMGDDGKVYTVTYTADENGFQPRGDHLPTPPPVPEAIRRVIEQATRDKEAGIVDDGSYDEAKYGYKVYQENANHRRPEIEDTNRNAVKKLNGAQGDQIKPIAGINDVENGEGSPQDQFNNSISDTRSRVFGKLPPQRQLHQIDNEKEAQNISGGNRKISLLDNDTPINEDDPKISGRHELNQFENFGTRTKGYSGSLPMSDKYNPLIKAEDIYQQNPKHQGSADYRPISSGVKSVKIKYPGSGLIDDVNGDYIKPEERFYSDEGREIDIGSPSLSEGQSEDVTSKFHSVTGAPFVDNRLQASGQRTKGNRQPTGLNRYNQNQKGKLQGHTQENINTPSSSDNIKKTANQPMTNQQVTQQDATGYHYPPPNTMLQQTNFPTRFSPQEVHANTKLNQRRKEFGKNTTRKPFITPNVYNQNDEIRQSTTRIPFTTSGVTSPTENSYTDYDDGDDLITDQDIDDDIIDSTKVPAQNTGATSRPHQSTQNIPRPQYTRAGQRTREMQKETPGQTIEHSGTATPGSYTGSTTPMPSYRSRFGSTEASQTTVPSSMTFVRRPVTSQSPSGTTASDFKYQTKEPVPGSIGTNLGPSYSATGVIPGSSLASSTPGVLISQSYPTSTDNPFQSQSSTTALPSSLEYPYNNYGSPFPSKTSGDYHLASTANFQTGYHYGPPKTAFSERPLFERPNSSFFNPSETSRVSSGTYPTAYQGASGSPSPTSVSSTSEVPETFILPQPIISAPKSSPIGIPQGNYQPSAPNYFNTIVSSTPGAKQTFGYPGSFKISEPEKPAGYEYGTSRPAYSTTALPSTIEITPGSFNPSEGLSVPFQGYTTTYRPGFQTTKDTFVSGPVVDGFGRPITSADGGSHPGFSYPDYDFTEPSYQESKLTRPISGPSTASNVSGNTPVDNSGPGFGGVEPSTVYPGSYDQSRVIGEDFSGPKQPQRFDPETGYHYK